MTFSFLLSLLKMKTKFLGVIKVKRLKIIFLTADGKRHTFTPKVNVEKMSQAEMQTFVISFLKKNQTTRTAKLFEKVEKAVILEKKTTPLFKKKSWQPKK